MKASDRTAAELKTLVDLPDSQIDTSDIPERSSNWTGAIRGRFRRNISVPRSDPRDQITPELRASIQRLSEDGMDIYQISTKLGVTPGRVRAIKAHFPRTKRQTEAGTLGKVGADLNDPTFRRKWLSKLLSGAKSSARKRAFTFELSSPAILERLYEKQDGRCDVSGIKFNLDRFPSALVKHPFAPSIDRKVSSLGYSESNVRLVCVLANFAMNEWGEEPFITVARGVVERDQSATDSLSDVSANAKWEAELRERISTAEELLRLLPPGLQPWQRSHIAGLKAALTKGLARSRTAAEKAVKTKKRKHATKAK